MGSTSKKEAGDPLRWRAATPGIPDDYFERTDRVPITKEEVRAIQISKARLYPGCSILDVGCGSGSITVEAAIQAGPGGAVTAIDRDEAAVELTRRNLERFNLKNVSVLCGDALGVIGSGGGGVDGPIPTASQDAAVIGGTGGATADIIKSCARVLKPRGRIVIGTILIETLHSVLVSMDNMPFGDVDLTQVTISKSRRTSTGTMMLARNPVVVISATRLP